MTDKAGTKAEQSWQETQRLLNFFNFLSQLPKFGQMSMVGNKLNCLVLQVQKLSQFSYEEVLKRVVLNPVGGAVLNWDLDYYYEIYGTLELIMHLKYSILEILALTANRVDSKYPQKFRKLWENHFRKNPALSAFHPHYKYIAEIRVEWTHFSGLDFLLDHDQKKVKIALMAYRQSTKDKEIHATSKAIDMDELENRLSNCIVLIQNILVVLFFELKTKIDLETKLTISDEGIKGKSPTGLYLGIPESREITLNELITKLGLDKITDEPTSIEE